MFLGTEFRKSSGRHKTEDLVFNKPQKRDIDKILDSSDGQAVYDRNENNVLATKNHFAEAVVNDQIEISNESWENFRHIFDKLKKYALCK